MSSLKEKKKSEIVREQDSGMSSSFRFDKVSNEQVNHMLLLPIGKKRRDQVFFVCRYFFF
jgi:hypothetical protein